MDQGRMSRRGIAPVPDTAQRVAVLELDQSFGSTGDCYDCEHA
jgi:hypothetical protein